MDLLKIKSEEMAEKLLDYVNSSLSRDEDFAERIMRSHRTLQQNVFRLFIKCVKKWAEQDKRGYYDPRNEQTVKLSAKIMEIEDVEAIPFI